MFIIRGLIALKKYSYLLSELVKRDFKIRYKRSFLGMFWSVLNPLLTMLILSVVFTQLFKTVNNYQAYLFSGLVLFNYFSEATNIALSSILSNFGLLTKVYIPKFILPISKTLSSFINLSLSMMAFYIVMILSGIKLNVYHLLIPYALICLVAFVMGVSLILSATVVFFRDMQHLYGVLLTMWMYATPILYPIEIIPENYRYIFYLNPLYQIINFVRTIVLEAKMPPIDSFIACFIWALGAVLIGLVVFKKTQDKFIYYV